MLKRNESDSFPGAEYVAADPVTGGECCLQSTIQSLGATLQAAGHPVTFRGGRLFADVDAAGLLTVCSGADPAVTGSAPDPLEATSAGEVTGTDFDVPEGKVWIGNANTYEGSSVKVEQTVDTWADELIDITVVKGGLPMDPTPVWVFVENACGRITAAGWETSLEDPI